MRRGSDAGEAAIQDRERRATPSRRIGHRDSCFAEPCLVWRTAAGGLNRGGTRGVATVLARRRACALGTLLALMWCATVAALSLDAPLRELRHTGWGPK